MHRVHRPLFPDNEVNVNLGKPASNDGIQTAQRADDHKQDARIQESQKDVNSNRMMTNAERKRLCRHEQQERERKKQMQIQIKAPEDPLSPKEKENGNSRRRKPVKKAPAEENIKVNVRTIGKKIKSGNQPEPVKSLDPIISAVEKTSESGAQEDQISNEKNEVSGENQNEKDPSSPYPELDIPDEVIELEHVHPIKKEETTKFPFPQISETEKVQMAPPDVMRTGITCISAKRFQSIEANVLGLGHPSISQQDKTRRFSNSPMKKLPRLQKTLSYPSISSMDTPPPAYDPYVQKCKEKFEKMIFEMRQSKMEHEKRFMMFLPSAFKTPTRLEVDVQLLYGLFKVTEVKMNYNSFGERMGSGTMSVPAQTSSDIRNWVPDREWRALKMLPFAKNRAESDGQKMVKLFVKKLSTFHEKFLKVELMKSYKARSVEMIYDENGVFTRHALVEMPLISAIAFDKKVDEANLGADRNYKVTVLEIDE